MVTELEVTPGETPELDEQGAEVPVKPPKRPAFKFSMVGISQGTELTFLRDQTKTCVVVDDRYVHYEGEDTALSPLTQRLLNYSTSPAGPDYWLYDGETLSERRKRLENEGTEDE